MEDITIRILESRREGLEEAIEKIGQLGNSINVQDIGDYLEPLLTIVTHHLIRNFLTQKPSASDNTISKILMVKPRRVADIRAMMKSRGELP